MHSICNKPQMLDDQNSAATEAETFTSTIGRQGSGGTLGHQYRGMADAIKAVDGSMGNNQEVWDHASQLGIRDDSWQSSVWYAQWSLAAERAALMKNGNEAQRQSAVQGMKQFKGRGVMPVLELKSLATKSADLVVEHCIWSLPNNIAKAGNDLYTSMWVTIEACLKSTATAILLDQQNGNTELRQRCIRLYSPFFGYLTFSAKSPLPTSLIKLSTMPERWHHIAGWPFGFDHQTTVQLAEEANNIARAHDTLAKAESRRTLEDKIEDSLKHGGGWLHKFVTNDRQPPASIRTVEGVIADPTKILEHHGKVWSGHWKTDDEESVLAVQHSMASLIQEVANGTQPKREFSAEDIRRAARRFPKKTAIGVDNWTFKEILLMPEPVLESLAIIVSEVQATMAPPLHC